MIIEQVINILFPFYDNLVNVISNEREFPSFNEFTRRLQLENTHNGNRVRIKVDEANQTTLSIGKKQVNNVTLDNDEKSLKKSFEAST
jgi:stringent starvation protein B